MGKKEILLEGKRHINEQGLHSLSKFNIDDRTIKGNNSLKLQRQIVLKIRIKYNLITLYLIYITAINIPDT